MADDACQWLGASRPRALRSYGHTENGRGKDMGRVEVYRTRRSRQRTSCPPGCPRLHAPQLPGDADGRFRLGPGTRLPLARLRGRSTRRAHHQPPGCGHGMHHAAGRVVEALLRSNVEPGALSKVPTEVEPHQLLGTGHSHPPLQPALELGTRIRSLIVATTISSPLRGAISRIEEPGTNCEGSHTPECTTDAVGRPRDGLVSD